MQLVEGVDIEIKGRTGVITLNRPHMHNAMGREQVVALGEAVDRLEKDPAVRVIVLTGAGERAFLAGGDIADLGSRRGLAHYREMAEPIHRTFRRFEICEKPTIGAVNGWALGGGTEVLLCLDIRLVADTAQLGLPEILLGIFPGGGGTQRLMRQIPLCVAKELMLTGRRIDARRAVELGLANRVVPAARLMEETMALAEEIAEKSPLALQLLKRAMLHGAEMPLSAALSYEHALIALAFDSDDAHEGCDAFLQKRKPDFQGR